MKTNLTFQIYAVLASSLMGSLGGLSKYTVYWLVFTLGGILIMLGHTIFDQKVKHSAGKIVWMIITSLVACIVVKFLYDENSLSPMSMIVATLVASMVAPATMSVVLTQLPDKIAEQVSALPEWLFGLLKSKIDKNNTKDE